MTELWETFRDVMKFDFLFQQFNQTFVRGSDLRLYDGSDLRLEVVSVVGQTLGFIYSGMQLYVLLSPYLCFIYFLYLDFYVLEDDTSVS